MGKRRKERNNKKGRKKVVLSQYATLGIHKESRDVTQNEDV